MRKNILVLSAWLMALCSCKKDYGDLNHSTVDELTGNATVTQLNILVTGAESGMRNNLELYLDDVGTIGREMYHFSGAEPRFVLDLPGAEDATLSNSNFYITNPWAARYQVIKTCNLIQQAASVSGVITQQQKAGYLGFARMIKAYQLLMNLNLTDSNGIRVEVSDPDHLGPIVNRADALAAIAALLDSSKDDLNGAAIAFTLAGFGSFGNAQGLTQVNRALAARVAIYREKWADALTYLSQSFFDLNGDLSLGAYHVFGSGSGDQLNAFFIPRNQTGEIRVAHPSYADDIMPGDDRIGKAIQRTAAASLSGLSSDRDVWVYTSSTAPVPIIRNEELILIYAEVKLQLSAIPDAIVGLNRIRTAHNIPPYAGAITPAALLVELLYERRYSLYCEGHRWIDLRRYDMLSQLPVDRPGDDVWSRFPLPVSEQ